MNLKDSIQRKISKAQKTKYWKISPICRIHPKSVVVKGSKLWVADTGASGKWGNVG